MRIYQIKYEFDGKQYETHELPARDLSGRLERKDDFYKKVLNRIESITHAGGVVLDLIEIQQ